MTNAADLPNKFATSPKLFVWDEMNAILVRIDSRGTGRSLCHRYAPLAATPNGLDLGLAFWDTWGEVKPRECQG